MKRILMAAVLAWMTGGVYAADFSDLQTMKASDIIPKISEDAKDLTVPAPAEVVKTDEGIKYDILRSMFEHARPGVLASLIGTSYTGKGVYSKNSGVHYAELSISEKIIPSVDESSTDNGPGLPPTIHPMQPGSNTVSLAIYDHGYKMTGTPKYRFGDKELVADLDGDESQVKLIIRQTFEGYIICKFNYGPLARSSYAYFYKKI